MNQRKLRHTDQSGSVSHPRFGVLLMVWLIPVLGWFAYLAAYANAPGESSDAPSRWPVESSIERSTEKPTLLMFIHPRCPCTQASLEELARLLAHCKGLADVYAVFVRPPGVPTGWERAGNWRAAAAIPDVHMLVDEDGAEARRFGATTSGHVQLYDGEGNLRFSGGITGARSHAGDNAGVDAVRRWLRQGKADRRKTFVFGCPLFSSLLNCQPGDVGCHP